MDLLCKCRSQLRLGRWNCLSGGVCLVAVVITGYARRLSTASGQVAVCGDEVWQEEGGSAQSWTVPLEPSPGPDNRRSHVGTPAKTAVSRKRAFSMRHSKQKGTSRNPTGTWQKTVASVGTKRHTYALVRPTWPSLPSTPHGVIEPRKSRQYMYSGE